MTQNVISINVYGDCEDTGPIVTRITEFFDVTSGSNGRCTTTLCRATAGRDGPTGIGSPNGAVLAP